VKLTDAGPERAYSVLVVDDDAMVRSWVRLSLRDSEFRIAAEASSVAEALELARRVSFDLVLVDYRLTDGVGTKLVKGLREAGLDLPAVLMTANREHGFNEMTRHAGGQGTILKTGDPADLLRTLGAVAMGELAFDRRYPGRLRRRTALTPRERDVLSLVAQGATNREAGQRLGIGTETVKTLLSRSFAKLGVQRRAQAVAVAQEDGIL
jgi:DNA-binding NarL/FixJ family response regulator